MSGDYEFLCNIYGISGASGKKLFTFKNFYKLKIGRHCCLWCTISNEELKIPRATRQQRSITQRSLATLSQKYSEFEADGSNLKKAKMHDNVIGRAFFDIPLSKVT